MVTFHHKQMRNMILPPKILLWPLVRVLPLPEICSKIEAVQHRPENPTESQWQRFACSCQAKLHHSLQHWDGCYTTHLCMSSGKQGQSWGCKAAYLTHIEELLDSQPPFRPCRIKQLSAVPAEWQWRPPFCMVRCPYPSKVLAKLAEIQPTYGFWYFLVPSNNSA